MSAGIRALLFSVPLILFALGGSFYVPPTGGDHAGESGSELALTTLPPLPEWANAGLPDFSQYRDTTDKKAAFFSFLYPRIVLANSRILIERDYLDSLSKKSKLTTREKNWLVAQADRLRVDADLGSAEQFALLHKRLDVIPPSLILAQAANESAWGTSRFAVKGNNLFGQWCFSRGCGLVPQSRSEGAVHEVAKFSSPYRSVRAYIQNLNRHPTYRLVRDIRINDRRSNTPLSGLDMAEGLLGYSERGEDYVQEIKAMIHYNNLTFYDDDFRAMINNPSPTRLQQLVSTDTATGLLPGQNADSQATVSGGAAEG
jgi:Bax protein